MIKLIKMCEKMKFSFNMFIYFSIPNWSEIPNEISGCEQQCFCETGVVECQAVCSPLPAIPPPSLKCVPPSRPAPQHPPGDTCCKEWMCVTSGEYFVK